MHILRIEFIGGIVEYNLIPRCSITFISNDTCVPALNIVMKTTACNGMEVAKISDTPGKGMCKNPEYVEYLERCIKWRMEND